MGGVDGGGGVGTGHEGEDALWVEGEGGQRGRCGRRESAYLGRRRRRRGGQRRGNADEGKGRRGRKGVTPREGGGRE